MKLVLATLHLIVRHHLLLVFLLLLVMLLLHVEVLEELAPLLRVDILQHLLHPLP